MASSPVSPVKHKVLKIRHVFMKKYIFKSGPKAIKSVFKPSEQFKMVPFRHFQLGEALIILRALSQSE